MAPKLLRLRLGVDDVYESNQLRGETMMYQKLWSIVLLILTVAILAGCAPKPYVDVYMEPITGQENTVVNAKTGSITVEQQGVQITLEPLDEVELFELTKDVRINPYILVNRRSVDPLYTVFEIRVRNSENKRVVTGEIAILIDEHGEQYGSLPYDYFKDLYSNVRPRTVVFQDIGYRYYYPYPRSYYRSPYRYHYPIRYRPRYGHSYGYGYGYPPYRAYHTYPDPHYLNSARMVLRETVFDGGKLFPGAKRSGLLVFDRLDIGATDVKVIIPQVLIINKEGDRSEIDFEFDFRQVVVVKE